MDDFSAKQFFPLVAMIAKILTIRKYHAISLLNLALKDVKLTALQYQLIVPGKSCALDFNALSSINVV